MKNSYLRQDNSQVRASLKTCLCFSITQLQNCPLTKFFATAILHSWQRVQNSRFGQHDPLNSGCNFPAFSVAILPALVYAAACQKYYSDTMKSFAHVCRYAGKKYSRAFMWKIAVPMAQSVPVRQTVQRISNQSMHLSGFVPCTALFADFDLN